MLGALVWFDMFMGPFTTYLIAAHLAVHAPQMTSDVNEMRIPLAAIDLLHHSA
jgi:hypothetical protein